MAKQKIGERFEDFALYYPIVLYTLFYKVSAVYICNDLETGKLVLDKKKKKKKKLGVDRYMIITSSEYNSV